MFELETKEFRLPEELRLTLFTSPEQFRRKVEKHFLNPTEPWGRLLEVRFLRKLGRKLRDGDVSELEDAYRRAVEVIEAGMRFAEATPLFVRVAERIVAATGREYHRDAWYFVADRGFVVIAHGGFVRTAYFPCKTPTDSNLTLYWEAWRKVRARALAPHYTNEDTEERVTNLSVERFTVETWNDCPLPDRYLPREPEPAARGYLPPEARAWLESL